MQNAQQILVECARWQYDRCNDDRKLARKAFFKCYRELSFKNIKKSYTAFFKACITYGCAADDFLEAKSFLSACQIAAYEGLATPIYNAYYDYPDFNILIDQNEGDLVSSAMPAVVCSKQRKE